jgi:alpha-L-fucosidase
MPRIATMARKAQPGLLVVDRTVHGPYENYQTPEQSIPKQKLDHPWESCITLGNAWGYVPNENYKSSARVIHTLIEVVAKGGSLLLGVGPGTDGTFNATQVERLKEVGAWLKNNGGAIYNSRTAENYYDAGSDTYFTTGKNNELFALVRLAEGKAIPTTISWTGNIPRSGSRMTLLSTGETVKWKKDGDKVMVTLPAAFLKKNKTYPALAFSFQK